MIYLIALISFLIEGILSKYLNFGIFGILPLLTTLVFTYPLFYRNEKKYIIYAAILGVLYDIIFINTMFFNMIIFILISIILIKLNVFLINSFVNTVILTVIVVFLYLTISYIGLVIGGYYEFDIILLLEKICNYLIFNIFYSLIWFIILEKVSVKYKILKVN